MKDVHYSRNVKTKLGDGVVSIRREDKDKYSGEIVVGNHTHQVESTSIDHVCAKAVSELESKHAAVESTPSPVPVPVPAASTTLSPTPVEAAAPTTITAEDGVKASPEPTAETGVALENSAGPENANKAQGRRNRDK
jgi:hypothetical protein